MSQQPAGPMKIFIPVGAKYLNFIELPALLAEAFHGSGQSEPDQLRRGVARQELERKLKADAGIRTLKVRSRLTFDAHDFPHGDQLTRALVLVDDLRDYLRWAGQAVEIVESASATVSIDGGTLSGKVAASEQERAWRDAGEREQIGRYRLREAAQQIAEATDEKIDVLLAKLMQAAGNRSLATYAPGSNLRYEGMRAREDYEEAYWKDLNKWLEDNEPHIVFNFPEPHAPARTGRKTLPGVTKTKILSVDWPMGKARAIIGSNNVRLPKDLRSILDEIPSWVATACDAVGKRGAGGNTHLWNPAVLALCLHLPTSRKRWGIHEGELTKVIEVHFPDYLEEWTTALENL